MGAKMKKRSEENLAEVLQFNRRSVVKLGLTFPVFAALALAAALTFAGCAPTQLVNQWTNPAYTAPSFKRIMVIGVTKQGVLRRTFEDEFVSQLNAAGANAVPSYRYIQEDGRVDDARLRRAVEQAGADAAIITRLVKTEQQTQATERFVQPDTAEGFFGGYGTVWSGAYEPAQVYHYEVYNLETRLYDVVKNQVVWAGMSQTAVPGGINNDINKEIKNYAEIMVQALKERNLI